MHLNANNPKSKGARMVVSVISIISTTSITLSSRPNFDLACSLRLQTEPQQNHQNSK